MIWKLFCVKSSVEETSITNKKTHWIDNESTICSFFLCGLWKMLQTQQCWRQFYAINKFVGDFKCRKSEFYLIVYFFNKWNKKKKKMLKSLGAMEKYHLYCGSVRSININCLPKRNGDLCCWHVIIEGFFIYLFWDEFTKGFIPPSIDSME